MTLRDILRAIWFGRWIVVGTLVAALATGLLFSARQQIEYQATATVQLGKGTSASGDVTVDPDTSRVTRPAVLAAAGKADGVGKIAPGQVAASYDSGSRTMTISARNGAPQTAERIANAVATAYVASLPAVVAEQVAALDAQIQRASEQVTKAREVLAGQGDDPVATALVESGTAQLTQLTGTETAYATLVTPGSVVATAQGAQPLGLSSTNVLSIAILGGILLGLGLALLRNALDQRVRSSGQAAALADAPVLAEVSGVSGAVHEAERDGRMPVASRMATPFTESVRELRTAVQVGLEHRDHVAVVVTAADQRAPRAFVAANLAVSFALSGRRTIVLAGDMRRPQIESMLPAPEGWAGAPHQLRPTRVPHLEVCPVPDVELDPADYLATQRARELVETLCRRADIVVVDAPPILAAADATILGGYAEGMVLVVGAGRTDRLVLAEAAERLRTNDVPLLGLAVTGVPGNRRTDYAVTYGDARREAWPARSVAGDGPDPVAADPVALPRVVGKVTARVTGRVTGSASGDVTAEASTQQLPTQQLPIVVKGLREPA